MDSPVAHVKSGGDAEELRRGCHLLVCLPDIASSFYFFCAQFFAQRSQTHTAVYKIPPPVAPATDAGLDRCGRRVDGQPQPESLCCGAFGWQATPPWSLARRAPTLLTPASRHRWRRPDAAPEASGLSGRRSSTAVIARGVAQAVSSKVTPGGWRRLPVSA